MAFRDLYYRQFSANVSEEPLLHFVRQTVLVDDIPQQIMVKQALDPEPYRDFKESDFSLATILETGNVQALRYVPGEPLSMVDALDNIHATSSQIINSIPVDNG